MRLVLAALFALYVLAVAALPHGHDGQHHDAHECIACTTAGGEPCAPAQPAFLAQLPASAWETLAPETVPSTGAPLGAIPGQSPPAV